MDEDVKAEGTIESADQRGSGSLEEGPEIAGRVGAAGDGGATAVAAAAAPAVVDPEAQAQDALEIAETAAYDAGFASGLATGRAEVRGAAVAERPAWVLPQAEPVGYCAGSFYLDLTPARALTLARVQAGLLQRERAALPANEVIGRILDSLAE